MRSLYKTDLVIFEKTNQAPKKVRFSNIVAVYDGNNISIPRGQWQNIIESSSFCARPAGVSALSIWIMSESLSLAHVQEHDLAVLESFIGVLQDGIELEGVSGPEFMGLVRQRKTHRAFQNPADLVVIVMDLRAADFGSFCPETVIAFGIRIAHLLKSEVT